MVTSIVSPVLDNVIRLLSSTSPLFQPHAGLRGSGGGSRSVSEAGGTEKGSAIERRVTRSSSRPSSRAESVKSSTTTAAEQAQKQSKWYNYKHDSA